MKTNKSILVTIVIALTSLILISCSDRIIPSEKLPAAAQSFLKEYFPDSPISYVKKEADLTPTYEVVLQNGTEIEFNKKGQWDNIDCKRLAVPAALIPAAISEYVNANFPGQSIVKIDRETYGHEIEMANGLELKFDKKGKLLHIDD
jgi:hypothetical protein